MSRRLGPLPEAEELVARALEFFAADHGRLTRFLNLTGLTPEMIRAAAAAPGFAASVLDYPLSDEPRLLLFAEAASVPPEQIARERGTPRAK